MMGRFATLLLVLVAGPAAQAAAPPPAVHTTFDIRYHPGKERHVLDVFAPAFSGKADPTKRYPVVFYVHGGTWMIGDKNHRGLNRGVGQMLARNGFVAVLINYRLSPRVRHPEHVQDVARAFAWTVKNVARFGGDPDQVIVAGHSAGGHLATLLVTDKSYLDNPELGLDARARKSIRAVVSLCGVYRVPEAEEFHSMAAVLVDRLAGEEGTHGVRAMMRPALFAVSKKANPFRMVFGTDPNVCKKASPIQHVRKGLPPMLLLNSESEVPGLQQMSIDFAKALKGCGNVAEVMEIPDCTHRSIVRQLHRRESDAGKAFLDFVSRYVHAPAPDGK